MGDPVIMLTDVASLKSEELPTEVMLNVTQPESKGANIVIVANTFPTFPGSTELILFEVVETSIRCETSWPLLVAYFVNETS